MTSEKMNHNILMRKDSPTWSLYSPPSLSRATVPNQPNIMKIKTAPPNAMIQGPVLPSLMDNAIPNTKENRPIDPIMGHALGLGR